jgi:phenylalanyl-tRNA synthetase beta chain
LVWAPFDTDGFARGQAALAKNSADAVVAAVGAVSDGEREKRRLPAAAFAGEILLDALPAAGTPAKFRAYSEYPAIEADLSFLQRRDLPWAEIAWFVRGQGLANLESLRLLDRYEGPGVGEGRIKTTIRLAFRAADRTLEQEEVNGQVRRLAGALAQNLGAEL